MTDWSPKRSWSSLTAEILYKSSVRTDLKQIGRQDVARITRQIRNVLGRDPRAGEPLHGEFQGLYKFRVGDYRVIYAMAGDRVVVLRIRHRAKAYG